MSSGKNLHGLSWRVVSTILLPKFEVHNLELEALESIFNLYKSRYLRIFEKIYPARNSTGFPERNLSVNFTKAYETYYLNCYVISWFELQFGVIIITLMRLSLITPQKKSSLWKQKGFLIQLKRKKK